MSHDLSNNLSQLLYMQDQQCWHWRPARAGWIAFIKTAIQRCQTSKIMIPPTPLHSPGVIRIQVIKGGVWLTRAWQATDHFLLEGSALLCHPQDDVLLQALGDTVLAYAYQAENSASMTVSGSPNKPAIMAKTVSMASVACAK